MTQSIEEKTTIHRAAQRKYKSSLAGKLTETRYRLTEKYKISHAKTLERQRREGRRKIYKLVNAAIKKGELIKKDCEICGIKKSVAHHDDYKKIYDVKWFCHKHHAEYHLNERR